MANLNSSEAIDDDAPATPQAAPPGPRQQPLSKIDIRHNMILLILMDTVWLFGATEMTLASSPLYAYLKASNTVIGLIQGSYVLGLLGIFLSPFITIRFPNQKILCPGHPHFPTFSLGV